MTDSGDESDFYVPPIVKRSFEGLVLPEETLGDVFDKIGGFIFEGENEIRPDETIWDSKTMIIAKKKLKTLDMFFKKVVKTEAPDSDYIKTSDESDSEEPSKDIKCKTSPDSRPQISSPEKERVREKNLNVTPTKNLPKDKTRDIKSREHSLSSSDNEELEKNTCNSPTYSVDLFAEEPQKSSDDGNKISPVQSNEETIPSSQVLRNSNKSNSQNSQEKEISSSSSEDGDNEQPTLSELDSIKNSMKHIKEVFSKIERNTDKFNFGDLTEDDELYILQCPSEVDSKKLKGVEIPLQGHSVLSVDEESKYDCFSIKENAKRYLYVALPDLNEQQMKLGFYRLSGNIILSENLGITYTQPIEDDALCEQAHDTSQVEKSPDQLVSKKKKDYENTEETPVETKKGKKRSKGGEDINFSFSDLNEVTAVKPDLEDSQIIAETLDQETPSKQKKKKKRSKEGKDINSSFSDFNEVSFVKTDHEESQIIPEIQDQETPFKTKKKKKKSKEGKDINSSDLDLTEASAIKPDQENAEILDQEMALKPKKKKKRSKEDKEMDHSCSDLNEISFVTNDGENSQIILETLEQETPLKVKKKKKKSKGETTQEQCFSGNMTDLFDKLSSKKKKRKHHSLESNEIISYGSKFDKFLNLKSELEEVISDFQETPLKSKKRSREYEIDPEEFSSEVPKKKKKKKHKYSENEEMV